MHRVLCAQIDVCIPSTFFSKSGDNNNAGLVFCPHRRWYFGVEDNAIQIQKNIPDLKIGTFMGGNGESNRDETELRPTQRDKVPMTTRTRYMNSSISRLDCQIQVLCERLGKACKPACFLASLGTYWRLTLRLPRCVSTGPVAVRLAEMAI